MQRGAFACAWFCIWSFFRFCHAQEAIVRNISLLDLSPSPYPYSFLKSHAVGTKILGIPAYSKRIPVLETTTGVVSYMDYSEDIEWSAGVMVGSKIICLPRRNLPGGTGKSIMTVDLASDSVSYSPVAEIGYETSALIGDKLIGLPFSAKKILVMNTSQNTVEYIPNDSDPFEVDAFGSSAVVNGKVIGLPYNSPSVLVVDPRDDSWELINLGGAASAQYLTAAVVGNKVIGLPFSAARILVVEAVGDSFIADYLAYYREQASKYTTSVAVGSKVVGLPCDANEIIVVDTTAGTWEFYGDFSAATGAYMTSAVVGTKVVGLPAQASEILIFDVEDGRITQQIPLEAHFVGPYYFGTSIAVGRSVYGMPATGSNILALEVPLPSTTTVTSTLTTTSTSTTSATTSTSTTATTNTTLTGTTSATTYTTTLVTLTSTESTTSSNTLTFETTTTHTETSTLAFVTTTSSLSTTGPSTMSTTGTSTLSFTTSSSVFDLSTIQTSNFSSNATTARTTVASTHYPPPPTTFTTTRTATTTSTSSTTYSIAGLGGKQEAAGMDIAMIVLVVGGTLFGLAVAALILAGARRYCKATRVALGESEAADATSVDNAHPVLPGNPKQAWSTDLPHLPISVVSAETRAKSALVKAVQPE